MNRSDTAFWQEAKRLRASRAKERARHGDCPTCGHKVYPVGPYMVCRNLSCKRLVA